MVVISCSRDVGNVSFVIIVVFPWLFVWPVPGMWAVGIFLCLSGGSLVSGYSPISLFLGEMLFDFYLV